MILRFLVGLNLVCFAGILAAILYANVYGQLDAAKWWRAAKANEFEYRACVTKHETLTRQIKKEGLWHRLGMPGQPQLQ